MNYRELHNVECIELKINGAGEYFFPRPSFTDKIINSIFLWETKDDLRNKNIYISIYSQDKKPLYVNVPAVEFAFDNVNNFIDEIIDFDLLKITYTGDEELTLYSWFSMDEKKISEDDFFKLPLNCRNIRVNFEEFATTEYFENDPYFKIFSDNDAEFFKDKTIRMIKCSTPLLAFDFLLNNGKSLKTIPTCWMQQTPVIPYANLMPLLVKEKIDLNRSYLNKDLILSSDYNLPTYIDITFYFE